MSKITLDKLESCMGHTTSSKELLEIFGYSAATTVSRTPLYKLFEYDSWGDGTGWRLKCRWRLAYQEIVSRESRGLTYGK